MERAGTTVDEMMRYDQRDALVYRGQLVPGTEPYETYYNMHPELRERDDSLRVYFDPQRGYQTKRENFPKEKLQAAWVRSITRSIGPLLKSAVDGPISEEKIEVDPVDMTRRIKGLAKYLGAGLVGVTELNQSWVYSHCGYLQGGDWGKPIELPHRYAIVMAFPHTWDLWLTTAKPTIPGFMDSWNFYNQMAVTAARLAIAIRDMGYRARTQSVANYTCVMPPLAVDAGLGEQCLIGICLTKEYGLAYRLCAVTTDLPLVADPPKDLGLEDFCIQCNKCIEACPSGALFRVDKVRVSDRWAWKQNVYRCFRFWQTTGVGCSICRRVCPWTKPRTFPHRGVSSLAVHMPFLRSFLIWADDLLYGRKPRYHPPPQWLQQERQERNPWHKILYWFDHI